MTPNSDDLRLREAGLGEPPPPPVGEMPAGGGTWPLPSHLTHAGVVNLVSRAFRFTHDEALKAGAANADAMRNDLTIRRGLYARKLITAQTKWHLVARDETDPRQAEAVEKLTAVIEATPRLQSLFMSLLEAVWYGRQGAQLLYKWEYVGGQMRMVTKDFRPIQGDKLAFRWSGDPGVWVNSSFNGDREPGDRGWVHWLTPAEREAVIVHKHEVEDSSFYQPDLAGSIMGTGIRGVIFWTWFLKANFTAQLCDYVSRFASGLWTGFFEEGNPEGKAALEAAMAQYQAGKAFVAPMRADGSMRYGVQVNDVGTANPNFLIELIRNYLDEQILLYILGQTATSATVGSLGGDHAGLMADTLAGIVRFDAMNLAETLTAEWLPVLSRYNVGPEVPPPKFVFELDDVDANELLDHAERMKNNLGADLDLEPLYSATGLTPPRPGSQAISSGVQPLSPVAVGNQPDGTPMAGTSDQVTSQQQVQPQAAPAQQQPASFTPVQSLLEA